MKLFFDNINTS